MQATKKEVLIKLFEAAYLIVLKGMPYSDYHLLLENFMESVSRKVWT